MGKLKISRPVLYALLLGIVAYAALLLTEPEKPATTPRKTAYASRRSTPSSATGTAGSAILPEDLKASFPPYSGARRDAFQPKVVAAKGLPAAAAAGPAASASTNPAVIAPATPGGRGTWVLTGLVWQNGQRSALVENPTTGDSVFLKRGEMWNGHRVLDVGQSTITLMTPDGRRTALTFPTPEDMEKRNAPVPGRAASTTPATPIPANNASNANAAAAPRR